MSQPDKSGKSNKSDTAVPRSGQQGRGGAAEDQTERNLDEALEETFPASDPIAVEPDKDDSGSAGRPGKEGGKGARTG
ncbi:hypothetical protein [Cupriavidus gilardii]|uniref:hypothetical protein n=1 Tax=Cupriavidus gilardii TaxID=82541 RepID=UPI0007E430D8|nr:hypothetical protein [Cupriavidus gilardii]